MLRELIPALLMLYHFQVMVMVKNAKTATMTRILMMVVVVKHVEMVVKVAAKKLVLETMKMIRACMASRAATEMIVI